MTVSTLHDNSTSGAPEADSGGHVRAEFQALISGSGFHPLAGRRWLTLTGSDRLRWLNGMVTNNVRDLAAGCGVYAFLLNAQGRILGDLTAYNRGDSILIATDQAQISKLRETFEHYIIMDDVEVSEVSEQIAAFGIAGPKSAAVLKSAGLEVPELAPLQFVTIPWRQIEVTVLRTDNATVAGYEVWINPASAEELNHALVTAGAHPVGAEAVDLVRIACGVPRYGQDIRERDLPQETGQSRALNFTKGCYVGQEIVERIRSRGNVHRTFTGFDIQGALPPVGTKIVAEDKEVGEITSAASLPSGDVALGYIRREAATKELTAAGTTVRAIEVPFRAVFP